MTDHAQYKKKYAHITPPIQCGEAAHLVELLEDAIKEHNLEEQYADHLKEVMTSDIRENGYDESARGSLDASLELNAQYRLNAAAITVMEMENIEALRTVLNKVPMNELDLDGLTRVNVNKPSIIQGIKDTIVATGFLSTASETQEAINNLNGMRSIRSHVKSCKRELRNL